MLYVEPVEKLFPGDAQIVKGPMFTHWVQMLIFGHWLGSLLEGFNLEKNVVAMFWGNFLIVFS